MFKLASAIARDSRFICDLELSNVRLMNDSRYDWLILIPKQDDVSEIFDLSPILQEALWKEVAQIAELMKQHSGCTKVNVANLGNVEPQLHMHIVARHNTDPAWPGPVWGHSAAVQFDQNAMEQKIREYAALISKA